MPWIKAYDGKGDLRKIHNDIQSANRPIDFFGEVGSKNELKKIYRDLSRIVHPDVQELCDKRIAEDTFKLLTELYKAAQQEYDKGIYAIIDPVEIYNHSTPMFEIDMVHNTYQIYEHVFSGEVADVYRGICNKEIVYLKVAKDVNDNDLIENEYKILSNLNHQSLPKVMDRILINNSNSLLTKDVGGIPMSELLKKYPQGIPVEHVMWILERLLSVTGYLHKNVIVHGNIKPENIIINRVNHNVSLVGFSFSISSAKNKSAKYQIINQCYTAPEVNNTMRVLPSSDIYSVGKIAIQLIGGDIKTNGMPITIDNRVRSFVRELVTEDYNKRPNDAWEMYHRLTNLRTEVYGPKVFKTLT